MFFNGNTFMVALSMLPSKKLSANFSFGIADNDNIVIDCSMYFSIVDFGGNELETSFTLTNDDTPEIDCTSATLFAFSLIAAL